MPLALSFCASTPRGVLVLTMRLSSIVSGRFALRSALIASVAFAPSLAFAQPVPAPRPPQPAAPDAAAQEARLKALEDKIKDLEKRTEDAETKAADVQKALDKARAEREVELLAAKKKADEEAAAAAKKAADDALAAKKKASDDKQASLDFAPEKTAFDFGDFSWVPGNWGAPERPFSYGPFTGELRVDVAYHYDFAHPKDNTISGSSEVFRSNEFQLTQLGIGGDFYYKGMQARLMTQFGMYYQTTPRNDASPARGQWNLADAYRYLSEAYAGYHINALYGINIQAGIFMSYVGLWSYYNFDNWTYQPSYVSSNTPWFFNGMRVQIFPNKNLKIEPWFVNGWQSYGKFNEAPGGGLQVLWRPYEFFSILGNQYVGTDQLGIPGRIRIHTDDSVMARFYNNPGGGMSKVAGSLTLDAGCEQGGDGTAHTNCTDQYFLGFMAYLRAWFWDDKLGLTVGGGAITNPGRYLVLLPPINGATAFSGTPYFTESPGDKYNAWDWQTTFDYMPTKNTTFRLEYNHRAASVPYFTGNGGVTPPGGDQGSPGSAVSGWAPDLVKAENRLSAAFMVKL